MARIKKPKPRPADDKHSFSIIDVKTGDVVARRLRARDALEKIVSLRKDFQKGDFRLVNDSPPPCLHPKKSK